VSDERSGDEVTVEVIDVRAGTDQPQDWPVPWSWAPWIILAMLVGRLIAVAGLRAYQYVDSAEYARIDFSGQWRRPWATPVLYWLLGHDPRHELWGQAVVGAICWSVLALAAAPWFRRRVVQITVVVAIMALGLTTSVTNWDAAVLSESLAISLTALVMAAWLTLVRRRTPGAAAFVLLATLPWLYVRQSLLPTAWMVVAAAVVGALVVKRPEARRLLAATAAGLVLLTGIATASYNRNQEVVHTNVAVIIANRIAPVPARLRWFRAHGMPVPTTGGYDAVEMEKDPKFTPWLDAKGRSAYTSFLISHPWYALTAPLPDLVGVRQSYADPVVRHDTMLSPGDAYGSTRPVIPEIVEQTLFDPGATGAILTALFAAVAWSIGRRRWAWRGWALPLTVIGIAVASLIAGWHGATPELPRLAIVAALMLRIALILQFAFLVEAELDHRGSVASPPAPSGASSTP